jgi:hypothetical protein
LVQIFQEGKMSKSLRTIAIAVALVATLTGISLAGCSADSSQNSSSLSGQQSSGSSGQQSVNQSTQQPSSSGQQPSGSSGQQPPDVSNLDAILNRAAEILGISSDDFIAAFNNAMPAGGPSGSGQQGQPPTEPPSDQQGQQPPELPSGQQQGEPPAPPSGQQPSQSEPPQFMTEVYEKMAAELNIAADDIAEAMTQAENELRK